MLYPCPFLLTRLNPTLASLKSCSVIFKSGLIPFSSSCSQAHSKIEDNCFALVFDAFPSWATLYVTYGILATTTEADEYDQKERFILASPTTH